MFLLIAAAIFLSRSGSATYERSAKAEDVKIRLALKAGPWRSPAILKGWIAFMGRLR
jgi:hypothetical protein